MIHKFLLGLMTETEEKEFFNKLNCDTDLKDKVAIEALLYKHCNIVASSNKKITDHE